MHQARENPCWKNHEIGAFARRDSLMSGVTLTTIAAVVLFVCAVSITSLFENIMNKQLHFKKTTALAIGLRSVAFASALCCASLAQAQSTVTVYGIVDAALMSTTNQAGGTKNEVAAGALSTSRWGFKGSEDLGGGLKANFNLESTLANDTGAGGSAFGGGSTGSTATFFDRISTVGLSGGFGTLNLGRQNMLGVDSVGLADPTGLAHAPTNPNVYYSVLNGGAANFGRYGTNDGGTALRQNNSIKYLTPMVSGFGGALMYGLGENSANSSASNYSGLSGYFTDGKSGVALAHAKLNNSQDGSSLTLTGGGAKFVTGAFTLNGTYAASKTDTSTFNPALSNRKIAVTGLGVDYAINAATKVTGAYYQTKQTSALLGDGKATQLIALVQHAMSKRTTTYASYTIAKADNDAAGAANRMMSSGMVIAGQSGANRLAVGVRHSF
jgi:predicted porin